MHILFPGFYLWKASFHESWGTSLCCGPCGLFSRCSRSCCSGSSCSWGTFPCWRCLWSCIGRPRSAARCSAESRWTGGWSARGSIWQAGPYLRNREQRTCKVSAHRPGNVTQTWKITSSCWTFTVFLTHADPQAISHLILLCSVKVQQLRGQNIRRYFNLCHSASLLWLEANTL